MKLKIEQLDSSVKGRVIRKTYKRRNAKLNRRLAKADLENAPTKPRYRGMCREPGRLRAPSYV